LWLTLFQILIKFPAAPKLTAVIRALSIPMLEQATTAPWTVGIDYQRLFTDYVYVLYHLTKIHG
jgi:hypothetical protein